MNKIIKKINLEDYKIRFPKKDEEESNWGKIANDFDLLNKKDISGLTELPLIEIKDKSGNTKSIILRYGTMIKVLSWLRSFLKSSKIYKICYRKDKKKAILIDEDIDLENYTGETIEFIDELPYEILWETGTTIWVNSDYKQFIKYFTNSGETGETIFYANEFLKFAEKNKRESGDTEGYIDIPLYIEEELADMGQFTSNVDFWVENKRYYLNDIAMDDVGDVYRLVMCETGETKHIDFMKAPTILNEYIEKEIGNYYKKYTGETIDIFDDCEHVYISGNSGNFYYVRPYYNGEMKIPYWQYVDNSETGKTGSGVTAITESKLLSLRRKKKSYDDDSNELPFIVIKNETGYTTELQYSINIPMNIIKTEDKDYYDYVESITYNENEKLIHFKYHIGAWENSESAGTGIIYEEEYPYDYITGYTCTYDGIARNFSYTAIDYTCQIKDKMELEENKLYAIINIDEDTIKSDDFQKVAYFKDENLLGIQKITEDIDIKIERGKSAAFERHQVLGEVSSFDDLINYKNGFFNLKTD